MLHGFSLQMLGSSDFPVGRKIHDLPSHSKIILRIAPLKDLLPQLSHYFIPPRRSSDFLSAPGVFFFLSLKADWWIFKRLSVCFYGSLPHEFFCLLLVRITWGVPYKLESVWSYVFRCGLGKRKKKKKKRKNCFLLYCCCKEKKKQHKIFLPVFQLFQAHDWLSRGRVLQKQWGRRRQSKVRQCAQIILHECTFLCKLCLFFFSLCVLFSWMHIFNMLHNIITTHQSWHTVKKCAPGHLVNVFTSLKFLACQAGKQRPWPFCSLRSEHALYLRLPWKQRKRWHKAPF